MNNLSLSFVVLLKEDAVLKSQLHYLVIKWVLGVTVQMGVTAERKDEIRSSFSRHLRVCFWVH